MTMTTQKDLQQFLSVTLKYEVDMLFYAVGMLQLNAASQSQLVNSMLEVACLHTRSLYEFFKNTKMRGDDIHASDFCENYSSPNEFASFQELVKKINKTLAHITNTREQEKVSFQDIVPFVNKLSQCLQHFKTQLMPCYTDAFEQAF